MDWIAVWQSAAMGVVEGITEYLPISSTGHLLLVEKWMGFEFHESFEVVIQTGAVLAVVVEYWRRFVRLVPRPGMENRGFSGWNGWLWLALTTLPACVLGLAFHDALKEHFFNPRSIAWALALGGAAMILLERLLPKKAAADGVDAVGWKRALGVGIFQCVAMIPGTSRSMCTILGGRLLGLDRKTAAEYSFFAAVPVLVLAGAYDFYKGLGSLTKADIVPYLVGLAVSYFVAVLAIRFLMRMLARHTLEAFGWYRLALAAAVWLTLCR
jgi:undecaprenyl-diphosphatase